MHVLRHTTGAGVREAALRGLGRSLRPVIDAYLSQTPMAAHRADAAPPLASKSASQGWEGPTAEFLAAVCEVYSYAQAPGLRLAATQALCESHVAATLAASWRPRGPWYPTVLDAGSDTG